MRDGAEGLANFGGVGDITVRRDEDGPEAGGVGGVADVGFGRGGCAGGRGQLVLGLDWKKRDEVGGTYYPS